MGHARALLGLPSPDAGRSGAALTQGWTSARPRAPSGGPAGAGARRPPSGPRVDPNIQRLENELSEKLGARVAIQHGAKGRGKLVVSYTSLDELDGIIAHIQ